MGKEVYLTKISGAANNNKYYLMRDTDDGMFRVEYGRVGASPQTRMYPISQWEKKYREKLNKGYTDRTELKATNVVDTSEEPYKEIEDAEIRNLVNELRYKAGELIRKQYQVSASVVTETMVQEADGLINRLLLTANVSTFNDTLEELFGVIPRRMGSVSDYLARSVDDFEKIINRERAVLDVMAGQVKTNLVMSDKKMSEKDKNKTILDIMGLKITPAKKTDIKKIKDLLGEDGWRLDLAWKVENKKTGRAFKEFMKKNPVETRLLWHGSRTENWWSILNTGLKLRPQAKVTGKMFGNGIYFAPKAKKSIGYTSLIGSYWAKGGDNHGYMALFEVAYGTPRHVSTCHGFRGYSYKQLKKDAPYADCVHAHAGAQLRNDEIIFYREDQMTVKYLVKLKG